MRENSRKTKRKNKFEIIQKNEFTNTTTRNITFE